MGKYFSASFLYIMGMIYGIVFIQPLNSQNKLIGDWEGTFMQEFHTVITLAGHKEEGLKGSIKMFSGSNLIQDDKIEKLVLADEKFTFYIPSKETSFEGSLNDSNNELSGHFNFPDGSKHTIRLKKKLDEISSAKAFYDLKDKKFEVQDLREDLLFLFSNLKEYHPNLYKYNSKGYQDELYERLNAEIISPMSLEDYYLLTSKLTDAVHCSHTGVRLPASYLKLVGNYGRSFPWRIYFADERAYYVSGHQPDPSQIHEGAEIISINGRTIDEIIDQLFSFIPSEGENKSTKYNKINKDFDELFYFIDDSDEFIIKFKSGYSVKVESEQFSDKGTREDNDESDNREPVNFNYDEDLSLGQLKISSFAIHDMEAYMVKLDSIFQYLEINNSQNLIVDLRDNSGGHPIFAAQLLSYLTNQEFTYFKRNEEIAEFEPLYNTMQPNQRNFKGNVYVFVNGGSLSTTGHLISLLKHYGHAVFIGEEPGSTNSCNDFSKQMTLPATGIVLNVPRTTFETFVPEVEVNEEFPIDHKVTVRVENLIQGTDSYMEVFKQINN